VGATRPADVRRDADALDILRTAFGKGAPFTTLVRMLGDGFGPAEFGLESALPDAPEQIVASAAGALTDRFASAYARLFGDHQHTLVALVRAGYQLPPELRAPGELALARQLAAAVQEQRGSVDPADYAGAIEVARQARAAGLDIDTPAVRATVSDLLARAVAAAVGEPGNAQLADAADAVLAVASELDVAVDVERPQELVYEALASGADTSELRRLGMALHLAVDRLPA
jgi:2-hydroxychromene-2-carboxylate isomerase